MKGAIALLEPLRGRPGSRPADLALLGTLYLEAGRNEDSLAVLGPLADGAAGPLILQNAGLAALALGQAERAEGYLRRAVAKAPVSPASRELGLLLGAGGRIGESYELLRPWIAAHPKDLAARLAAAYDAVELNRPPEAEELLAGLPEDGPRVRLLRGRLQLLKAEPRQAIATLEPLLGSGLSENTQSLDLDARRSLAEAHLALGEPSAVVTLLQGRTGTDPSLALLLGRAQLQAGSAEDAAATLAPVAAALANQDAGAGPDDGARPTLAAAAALEYGRALVATAQWPDAVTSLERATHLDPGSVEAWQMLAQALSGAGRRDDAVRTIATLRELQKSQKPVSEQVGDIERGVSDPTGRELDRARTLLAQGKGDEALALIRREAALAPATDLRPRIAEVDALLSLHRAGEALKAADAALAAAPGNPELLALRGKAAAAVKP